MSDYSDYGFNQKPPTSAKYLRSPTLSLIADEDQPILDLGCGNGWLAIDAIKKGLNVYGIDASPSGVAVAKEKYPERFFLQDLRSESLPPEIDSIKFKTIISTEVIEHLYDPIVFLEFCATILRRNGGGNLIISTPYHGYLKNMSIGLLGGWDKHFMALRKGEHIKFWSRATLTQALAKAGFEVTDFKGAGRVPYLWKSMILKASLKK